MGKAPTPSVRSGKGASRHKSKTEAGDKPFACNHCAARFAHMSGLSRHDRVSHRNGALVQLRRPELTDAVKAQLRRGQWQRAQEARRKPQGMPSLVNQFDDEVAVQGGERFSCSATGERVAVEEVLKVSTLIIGQCLSRIGLCSVASTSGPVGLLLQFTERRLGHPLVTFDCAQVDQTTRHAITRGIVTTIRICDWPQAVEDSKLECVRPGPWLSSAGVLVRTVPQHTPITGSSVALAACLAMFSLMAGRPCARDVAASGGLTLAGLVLPVLELDTKRLACQQQGVNRLLVACHPAPAAPSKPLGFVLPPVFGQRVIHSDDLLPFFRTHGFERCMEPTTAHLDGLSYKDEMKWWPKRSEEGASEVASEGPSPYCPVNPRHAVLGFCDTLLLTRAAVAEAVSDEGTEETKEESKEGSPPPAPLAWQRVCITVVACRGQGHMTLLGQPDYQPMVILRDWLRQNAARVDGLPSDWGQWDVWVDLPHGMEIGPHDGVLTGAILIAIIRAFRGIRQAEVAPSAVLVPLLGLGGEVVGGYGPLPLPQQDELLALLHKEGLRLLCPRGSLEPLRVPAAAAKVWVEGVSDVVELLCLCVPGALHAHAPPTITTLTDIKVLRLPDWEGQETTATMPAPETEDVVPGAQLEVYGKHCWDMEVNLTTSSPSDDGEKQEKQIARAFVQVGTLLYYKLAPDEQLCLELRAGPGHRYLILPQSDMERKRLYSLSRLTPRLIMPVEDTIVFSDDRAWDPKAAMELDMSVFEEKGVTYPEARLDQLERVVENHRNHQSTVQYQIICLPPEAQRSGLL